MRKIWAPILIGFILVAPLGYGASPSEWAAREIERIDDFGRSLNSGYPSQIGEVEQTVPPDWTRLDDAYPGLMDDLASEEGRSRLAAFIHFFERSGRFSEDEIYSSVIQYITLPLQRDRCGVAVSRTPRTSVKL